MRFRPYGLLPKDYTYGASSKIACLRTMQKAQVKSCHDQKSLLQVVLLILSKKCNRGVPSCSTCRIVYHTACCYSQDRSRGAKGVSVAPAKDNWQLPEDLHTTNAHKPRMKSLQSSTNEEDIFETDLSQKDCVPEKLGCHYMGWDAKHSFPNMDVPLPQVLGPETLEMEIHKHRTNSASWTSINETTGDWPGILYAAFETRSRESMHDITPLRACRWFRESYDPNFIAHLLDLYFCWIHPSY